MRMSGVPRWAICEPSAYSTSECTMDCGCTTTSMSSGATPYRWYASMTSSPLFISVAESMVIFAPMDQLGWFRACSRVTVDRKARSRPRNGPPDAVRMIRRTASGARAPSRKVSCTRRAWNTALCSESTGSTTAPV